MPCEFICILSKIALLVRYAKDTWTSLLWIAKNLSDVGLHFSPIRLLNKIILLKEQLIFVMYKYIVKGTRLQ